MPNYAHSVIYRIINKETGENLYVGSTTNFKRRILDHKKCCINPNHRDHNIPIYTHIRDIGGWEFIKAVMIEEFTTCQNRLQLVKREQEHIENFKSSKNSVRSYISETQKKEEAKEYKKQYCNDNKEKIKEYKKQYCNDNKEKINEYKKQYHNDNRDKINEQRRLNRLKKKEDK
jgi:hypothetical protein